MTRGKLLHIERGGDLHKKYQSELSLQHQNFPMMSQTKTKSICFFYFLTCLPKYWRILDKTQKAGGVFLDYENLALQSLIGSYS